MKELFTMWRYTNMIVLTALSAAVFAALLIPFQAIPIIPGHVSLRVANVLPLALGLMFGPAGAWGAGIGNLIGDFFGTLSPGAVGGFVSNFMSGFLAYKMWGVLSRPEDIEPDLRSLRKLVTFEVIAVTKALAGSLLLTFWVCLLLRLAPPHAYAVAVMAGSGLAMIVGGPIVTRILYPRMRKWNLLWTEIMKPEDVSEGVMPKLGLAILFVGVFGGAAVMFYLLFRSGLPIGDPLVRFAPLPFIVLFFAGSFMLGGRKQVEAMQAASREADREAARKAA